MHHACLLINPPITDGAKTIAKENHRILAISMVLARW